MTAPDPRLLSAEIRARHVCADLEGFPHCNYCGLEGHWPCDAYLAADALDAAQQQIARLEAEIHDRHNVEMAYADQEVARLRAALAAADALADESAEFHRWFEWAGFLNGAIGDMKPRWDDLGKALDAYRARRAAE